MFPVPRLSPSGAPFVDRPNLAVALSAPQTIPDATDSVIAFDTVFVDDPENPLSLLPSGRILIPFRGVFIAFLGYGWDPSVAAGLRQMGLAIDVAGSLTSASPFQVAPGGDPSRGLTFSWIIGFAAQLPPPAELEVQVRHDAGGPVDLTSATLVLIQI